MAEEKLHIKLHIYDTDLHVNTYPDDEHYYRDAAKFITDIVNSYASIYKGMKSDKDILYMALLDIAFRYEKECGRNDTKPFSSILTKLTSEIEETLGVKK